MTIHFFSWDAERTLEDTAGADKTRTNNGNNPSFLFNQLLRADAFRQRVLSRVQLHFFDDGALTPARAAARYTELADQIEDAMVAKSARWGDAQRQNPLTRNDAWIPERDRLLQTWFPKRTAVVLEQLNAAGNLGYIKSPLLKVSGNSVEILATKEVVYFTIDGSDPRQEDGRPNSTATIIKGVTVENVLLPRSSEWKYLDDGSARDRPGLKLNSTTPNGGQVRPGSVMAMMAKSRRPAMGPIQKTNTSPHIFVDLSPYQLSAISILSNFCSAGMTELWFI